MKRDDGCGCAILVVVALVIIGAAAPNTLKWIIGLILSIAVIAMFFWGVFLAFFSDTACLGRIAGVGLVLLAGVLGGGEYSVANNFLNAPDFATAIDLSLHPPTWTPTNTPEPTLTPSPTQTFSPTPTPEPASATPVLPTLSVIEAAQMTVRYATVSPLEAAQLTVAYATRVAPTSRSRIITLEPEAQS